MLMGKWMPDFRPDEMRNLKDSEGSKAPLEPRVRAGLVRRAAASRPPFSFSNGLTKGRK
jgi:hypothetical protein